MKKPTLISLLLVAVLLLTGCNLIEIDPEVDAKTVVAEVGAQKITKGDALVPYSMTLSSYISLYNSYLQYGLAMFNSEEELITAAKTDTLNSLTKRIVLENEFAKRGLSFTDEERAAIDEETLSIYEEAIVSSLDSDHSHGGTFNDEESLRAHVVEDMEAQGYTMEYIHTSIEYEKLVEKLRADVVKGAAVTDAEVSAAYALKLEEQQASYDATPTQLATDMNSGKLIVYRPEGYRYVKNLLIGLPEDIQTQITEQEDVLYVNSYNRYQLQSQLSALESVDEETQAVFDGLIADIDVSDEEANAKVAELRAQGLEAIKAKAEEVLLLAQAEGADFDALIVEYGEDTGMTAEPAKTNGYALHEATTSYVDAFKQAGMALAQPGDISELVETDYGYHIIQYASDVPAGPVEESEVATAIADELLTAEQDELYTAAETEWVSAAGAKIYVDRWR